MIQATCIGSSTLLNLYKNEAEKKSYKDIEGNIHQGYVYTDRGFLARHKVLLLETLGHGRYSKVKKAYDLNHLRQIAIKIIDCNKLPKDFKDRFLPRELSNWPKLKHQNIITMFDCITNHQKIYMILEYANGGDMLSYIQNIKGPVPEKESRLWMKQICFGVKYLHSKNIIHRDLKLENVLIDSQGNMKVCDFGFSKDISECIDELCETYCGSKAYASPEILLGLPYGAKKGDVWAVGVIFYIILTGNMPFKEDRCNQNILDQTFWLINEEASLPNYDHIMSQFKRKNEYDDIVCE